MTNKKLIRRQLQLPKQTNYSCVARTGISLLRQPKLRLGPSMQTAEIPSQTKNKTNAPFARQVAGRPPAALPRECQVALSRDRAAADVIVGESSKPKQAQDNTAWLTLAGPAGANASIGRRGMQARSRPALSRERVHSRRAALSRDYVSAAPAYAVALVLRYN